MSDLTAALDAMFEQAPRDWWAFVPCGSCNQRRQEPCIQGGWGVGLAHHPHAARVRSALTLHATLWLLREGYAEDVLGPGRPHSDAQGQAVGRTEPLVALGDPGRLPTGSEGSYAHITNEGETP